MIYQRRRHRRRTLVAALSIAGISAGTALSASADNVTQLQTRLGQTQAQLDGTRSHEQTLDSHISKLNGQVSDLAGQVNLVRSREYAADQRLAEENAGLAGVRAQTTKERRRLKLLHKILARARRALAAELLSQYEQPQQSFMSLVINSGGFQELLDGLQFMSRAKRAEQTIVSVTRTAQSDAIIASRRLLRLQAADTRAAADASTQSRALAGMSAVLTSREDALADERSARSSALAASRSHGAKLDAAISTINKQEAAAREAAREVIIRENPPTTTITTTSGSATTTATSNTGTDGVLGTSGGSGTGGTAGTTVISGSGGWAIPYAVVLCESGGQDLPPNGAGASGYYQIVPATWKDFGGGGSAAYLAPKTEQDAVAAKIWNNGSGASNWTCSRIVGVT